MIKKGINGEIIVVDGDKLYVSNSDGIKTYDRASMEARVIEITATEVSFSDINTVQLSRLYDQLKENPEHKLLPELQKELEKELDARYVLFKEAIKESEKEQKEKEQEKKQPEAEKDAAKEDKVRVVTYIRSADGDHQATYEQEGKKLADGSIELKTGETYNRSVMDERQRNIFNQDNRDFYEDFAHSQGRAIDSDDKLQDGATYEEVSHSSSSETFEAILAKRDEVPSFKTEDYDIDIDELSPTFSDPRWETD